MQDRSDRLGWIQRRLGYRFRDKNLLLQALTHSSAARDPQSSNERLEFLGDSVLGFLVSEILVEKFPFYKEGDLSLARANLISAGVLAERAKSLGLDKVVFLGKGLQSRKEIPRSILANLFEAMVAAIYIDGGLEGAKRFLLKNLDQEIQKILQRGSRKDYKSLLQDYVQKRHFKLPNYIVVKERGPEHMKKFFVVVEVAGKKFGPAKGSSKREAQQTVAKLALEELKNL
jgi:ribonuclease-3